MLEKWSVLCTAPVSTWLLLLFSTFTRAASARKWSPATIYGQKWTSLNYFPPNKPFPLTKHCKLLTIQLLFLLNVYRRTTFLIFICSKLHIKSHSNVIFPRTTDLWNKLLRRCCPNNLNKFKSRVKRYLSHILA